MKAWVVPILVLFAGCASSTEQLTTEAHECVTNYVDERGVMGKPSDEARTACWAPVNKRLESIERREGRDMNEGSPKCHSGMVAVCNWAGCGCMRRSEIQRILRGSS